MRRLVAVVTVLAALAVPAPPVAAAPPQLTARVVQSGLSFPWDVAFTRGGKMVVTLRGGEVRVYAGAARGARVLSRLTVPRVRADGEAGVMGVAVTRRNDRTLMFVCASRQLDVGWRNQVLRYVMTSTGRLRRGRAILGGMRAATIHNGCAVEVGPDGKLWVSMGDAGDLSLPQSRSSRNGKLLRVNLDGSIPADNPFRGSPVYAMGVRNPQGIAFYPGTRRAYSIEHGPDVHDEVNRIVAGGNYGWPCWTGRSTPGPRRTGCRAASAYRPPAWSSGTTGTLATSNGVFMGGTNWRSWRNNLFVATLKERDVRRFVLNDTGTRADPRGILFDGRWGRLRAAVSSRDGRSLYLTTSNGGGTDRIIRVTAS